MPDDELQQLAARGRDVREKKAREPKRRKKRKRSSQRQKHKPTAMESRAFGTGRPMLMALVGFGVAGIGLFIYLMFGMEQLKASLGLDDVQIIVALVGVLALALGSIEIARRLGIAAQFEWLDSLPFEFPRKPYLKIINEQYERKCLVVTVGFVDPVPGEARGTLADAVQAVNPDGGVTWNDAELVVVSPVFETKFKTRDADSSTSTTTYNNRELHGWLRRTVDDAVLVVHRSYPVASVAVAAK